MGKLIRQIAVLSAGILIVCLIWRLSLKNTYTARFPLNRQNPAQEVSDGTDAARVEYEFRPEEEERLVFGEPRRIGDYCEVEIHPLGSGRAEYTIIDTASGQETGFLIFQVGRFGTVYDRITGGFTGDTIVLFALSCFFLSLSFLMLRYFIHVKGAELYSYYTIYTSGFSLFSGMTGLQMLYAFIRHLVHPESFFMINVYEMLSSSASAFLMITSPLLLAFSILMAVSNIELLRHEKPRLQNLLGILAAVMIIGGAAAGILLSRRSFIGSYSEYKIFQTVNNVYCTAFVYFECMLAGAVICGIRAALHKPSMDRDYIIILGCRFRKDGSLTPLLKGRCDRAIEFFRQQEKETGRKARFIPSGGQGPDESMPEAEAMAGYLKSCGIPENLIEKEERSKNTFQNMAFSKEIIEHGGKDAKTVFSTTNYHVFRSGVWAGLAGLEAEGIGSSTKWWFWPNAFLRECLGLLRNRIRQEMLLLVVITAFFAVLTIALDF